MESECSSSGVDSKRSRPPEGETSQTSTRIPSPFGSSARQTSASAGPTQARAQNSSVPLGSGNSHSPGQSRADTSGSGAHFPRSVRYSLNSPRTSGHERMLSTGHTRAALVHMDEWTREVPLSLPSPTAAASPDAIRDGCGTTYMGKSAHARRLPGRHRGIDDMWGGGIWGGDIWM